MSWATHFHKTDPTENQLKNLAYKMSHSTNESALYKFFFKHFCEGVQLVCEVYEDDRDQV